MARSFLHESLLVKFLRFQRNDCYAEAKDFIVVFGLDCPESSFRVNRTGSFLFEVFRNVPHHVCDNAVKASRIDDGCQIFLICVSRSFQKRKICS